MIDVLYLVGNIFYVLALEYFFENCLNRKKNKYITLTVIMIIVLISDKILNYFNGVFKIIVYTGIIFLLIFFLYDNTINKKIIVLVQAIIFPLLSEMFAEIALQIMKIKSNNYILGYVLSKLLLLLIVRLYLYNRNRENDYTIKNKILVSVIFIPLISIVLIVLFYFSKGNTQISSRDIVFYSLIFTLNYINILQYENVQEMLRLQRNNELLREQKKSYLYQYEQNQKNVESIKKIKHNIKNDYISEMIMLENKEYDKLQALYKQKVDSVENISSISNSGNNVFDTIINYKLSEIKRDNIKFDTNIAIPKELGIKDEDIILVLGNLLDNMSEALVKCKVGDRYAKLNVLYDKGMLYIETCNTYNKVKKDKDGNIMSSKKDADWHGIGLKAIEDIVEKYNGDMVITDDDNYFTVKIIMEV